MFKSALGQPSTLWRWELAVVTIALWLALISIPLALGEIGINWDALNHHIYLGWSADKSRLDQDFLAASSQSYQFPYLYWPAYKLSASGFSGASAGVVLASLNALAAPPIWMIARTCIPGENWFEALMRVLAVLLGFMSSLVLSLLDTTSNDILASIPLLWALAIALHATTNVSPSKLSTRHGVILSGFLAGVAVACKLSNGPLAILFPFIWMLTGGPFKQRLWTVVAGCSAILAGFILTYGPWGWQLWQHFGNPVYPFFDWVFEPLRSAIGQQP